MIFNINICKRLIMEFINKYVYDTPADLSSMTALKLKQTIKLFPQEAIYIYSLTQKQLVYVDGWKNVLGYSDSEVTLKLIFNSTSPKYLPFSLEINNRALQFLENQNNNLEEYSLLMELEKIHKSGELVPFIVSLAVFSTCNNKVQEIIGRFQMNNSIILGNVMKYASFGPEKSEFEDLLNKALFSYYAISFKELEAIDMISNGLTFKEIAYKLNISHSAVEKRILPLYKKFGVFSMAHLVRFCFENHLLPLTIGSNKT